MRFWQCLRMRLLPLRTTWAHNHFTHNAIGYGTRGSGRLVTRNTSQHISYSTERSMGDGATPTDTEHATEARAIRAEEIGRWRYGRLPTSTNVTLFHSNHRACALMPTGRPTRSVCFGTTTLHAAAMCGVRCNSSGRTTRIVYFARHWSDLHRLMRLPAPRP